VEASTPELSTFPGVEDLAAQGQDRLELAIARLLRAAAGGIALDQEQLGAAQVLRDAVGEFAGQGGPLGDLLAHDLFFGLQARGRALDGQLGDQHADFDVLVQPQREGIVHRTFDEARGLARAQALLGLAAELRVGHLQREHEADAVPYVFRRELHAARQQVAEIAELAQRYRQARAQAVDVRAALDGGNQVDVAFLHQLAFGAPGQAPIHDLAFLGERAGEQFRRQRFARTELAAQVIAQAILVVPLVALAAGLVDQAHGQAGAEHCLGAQQVAQRAQRELRRCRNTSVRPEAQAVPVFFLPTVATVSSAEARKPSRNSMRRSTPSRLMKTSTFVDNAFTTLMPTPCRPPEKL
jgi:hypothetical protein